MPAFGSSLEAQIASAIYKSLLDFVEDELMGYGIRGVVQTDEVIKVHAGNDVYEVSIVKLTEDENAVSEVTRRG